LLLMALLAALGLKLDSPLTLWTGVVIFLIAAVTVLYDLLGGKKT